MANVQHSSASAEHYTPPAIADMARAAMGGIDLDPATCLEANRLVQAKAIISQDWGDGLALPWHLDNQPTRVWLNPPGGALTDPAERKRWRTKSRAVAWWRKLIEESREGRVESACFMAFSLEFLQAAQVNGEGWTSPLDWKVRLCIPSKRIRFWLWDGSAYYEGGSPTHANAVLGINMGLNPFEAFAPLGAIVK